MSEIKVCVVGYIPPSKIVGAQAFYENITRFKTANPLILYSDADYQGVIKLKGNPEIVKGSKYPDGRPNPWAINNLIFLTGLSIAKSQGYTHMLYVESDCRVNGDNWDKVVIGEAFLGGDPVVAGTIVTYFCSNVNMEFTKTWNRFIASSHAKNRFPITAFGGLGAADKARPSVFANGALGIYDIEWLASKMDLGSCPTVAKTIPAWDYQIGTWLVEEFGVEVFNKVKHLDSVYSGYGNIATSEEERKSFLTGGEVVAVHQIKSDWTGPMREDKPLAVLEKVEVMPRAGILIVSYLKDIEWLDYCLTSIDRFATGFVRTVVAVPRDSQTRFKKLMREHKNVSLWLFDEAKGKGHLHQNAIKCIGDEIIHDADFILHLDSDCVFTEPVTPLDYFVEGKPVLCYQPYDSLPVVENVISPLVWQVPTEESLGFRIDNEFMRRHPAIHYSKVYSGMRDEVQRVHRESFFGYVMRQKATFPFGFSEFNSLGAWAWCNMRGDYHWVDVSKEPYPPDKVLQMWSHGSLDEEREFRFNGAMIKIKPREYLDRLLDKYKVS